MDRRAGRLADGWFPQVGPGPELDAARAFVEQGAGEAGRDPSRLGMEGRVGLGPGSVEAVDDHVRRWRDAGATHVSINTMGAGLGTVDQHVEALARVASALALS